MQSQEYYETMELWYTSIDDDEDIDVIVVIKNPYQAWLRNLLIHREEYIYVYDFLDSWQHKTSVKKKKNPFLETLLRLKTKVTWKSLPFTTVQRF